MADIIVRMRGDSAEFEKSLGAVNGKLKDVGGSGLKMGDALSKAGMLPAPDLWR